jgi:hypothetical protein
MKKCITLSLISIISSYKVLAVGEIAFTSYRTSGGDEFSFVALVNIPAGLEINFTDSGWKADNTGFRTGEGIIKWTAPGSIVPAGTQITINVETGNVISGSGTSSETNLGFDLVGTGDQIIAYIVQNGTSKLIPIAAVDFNLTSAWDADATSTSTSALPQALINGTTAIALTATNDNGKYSCTTNPTTGNQASQLSTINDKANWTTSNSALIPSVSPCTFTVSSPALPIQLISFNGESQISSINLNWQTTSETQNEGFEIQKSRNAVNFETFGRIQGSGDSENLNSYSYSDTHPFEGINYYRLKQNDFDGGTDYSKIIQVLWEVDGAYVSLYPNPLRKGEILQIQKSDELKLQNIYNLNGQASETSIESLSEGFYFLHFTNDTGERIVKKLIIN